LVFLLAEVPLAGVLPLGVLLVTEGEMESAESGFLQKKGMILLGFEILGEEKASLFFGVLLVIWYSWNLFSSVDWTGGHRQSYFWSLPMYRCTGTTVRSL